MSACGISYEENSGNRKDSNVKIIVAITNLNIKVIPETKWFFFMSYSGMIKR